MKNNITKSRLFVVSMFILLGACATNENIKPNDPQYAPVVVPSKSEPRLQEGSLYSETHSIALFGNTNHHAIGDIITVNLDERTVSSKSSSVGIDKESDISLLEGAAGNSSILGKTLDARIPLLGEFSAPLTAAQSRAFAGDASADQSNSLQGNISVTITDILPNGNLVVRGEKWLTLNRGEEFIRISGILRPEDVTLENTVLSTKLANARIAYSGTGELADSQKVGWLQRFFNSSYWPF